MSDKKIKVVYVYKDFDIFNGLIQTFMILGRRRKNLRFDFEVCVFNYKGSPFGEKFIQYGGSLVNLQSAWEDNPWIIWKLYNYFKKEKPDIVHTFILKPNLYGRIAAILAGVPIIVSNELTHKDQAPTSLKRFRDKFLHPINRILNRFTDHIIFRSVPMMEEWKSKVIEGRTSVIPAPFDIEKIDSTLHTKREKKGGKNDPWVVGIVGRLSEEKRHRDLFIAFRKVKEIFPNSRLLIVGDGEMRGELELLSRNLGIDDHVDFVGFQENVSIFLRKMDLFVLPSRTEGTPLTIFEAMASGLPVIATNVGGIPGVVLHDETGILIKPGHPESLADNIIKLLSDPTKMADMGTNGRKRVIELYHPDNFIKKYENIYLSLANSEI